MYGDLELRHTLTELFIALERPAGDARAVFSVGRKAGPGTPWQVRMDGELMMGCEQVGEALHGLMVYVNRRVVTARDDLLSIHAAAVATANGAIVLPGSSGSGKTTLCARLLQLGAAYLSDDSVALNSHQEVLGYPKALGFKVGTWEQFTGGGLDDLDLDHGRQLVWQIPPGRLGGGVATSGDPAVVVVPRFEPGVSLRVEPMPRHAGAAAILGQAQNLLAFGVPGALEVVGRLTSCVPSYTVVYGDAREAAPVVLDLVGSGRAGADPYAVFPPQIPSGDISGPLPVPDVSSLCFEDGGLLVRGETGEFAVVDRIGAQILSNLDGHRTIESICAELASLFGAPLSDIASDVSHWITDLVGRGFLLARP